MPGITAKVGGIRSGGTEANRTWHTLATLKALPETAQIKLAEALSKECRGKMEGKAAFKDKVAKRWRGDTLVMLLKAEAHWRSEADLPAATLAKTGSLVKRWDLFALSFFQRLEEGRIDLAIATAKATEGDAAKTPAEDGLDIDPLTIAKKKKRQKLATVALSGNLILAPSLFRALSALQRC
jgi:hypothetical protein